MIISREICDDCWWMDRAYKALGCRSGVVCSLLNKIADTGCGKPLVANQGLSPSWSGIFTVALSGMGPVKLPAWVGDDLSCGDPTMPAGFVMPAGRYPGVFDLDVAIFGLALDGSMARNWPRSQLAGTRCRAKSIFECRHGLHL